MKTIKTKIYLNNMAQKLLFGYFEGVDWQIGLTTQDADGTEREMTEKEQDLIHDKVLTWIDDYRKKYNGKFSEIEVDLEIAFYLSTDSDNQASLISSEVLSEYDVEDIFEDYWCYKTNRQKRRIKAGKENLYKEYKLAEKQLNKLSKIDKRLS